MAVRTLDQVVSSLKGVYDPQVKSIQQQQALIPQGVEADISQAKAEQGQAYENILSGARQRGLGFSGIPLGEQAKYASTVFAPEVLRARQRGAQQKLSLTDTLNQIYERRNNQAQGLYQQGIANDQWNQTFGFEKQKWADQLRQQAADRAEAARARAASAGSYSGGYLGGSDFTTQGGQAPQRTPTKAPGQPSEMQQRAFNEVKRMLESQDPAAKARELRAIKASAGYGNQLDKMKLIFLSQQLGGYAVPVQALGNGGSLRF